MLPELLLRIRLKRLIDCPMVMLFIQGDTLKKVYTFPLKLKVNLVYETRSLFPEKIPYRTFREL